MELMNIKLGNVIAQIHGANGLRIIKVILSGERDLDRLADLCHERILERKRREVKKILERQLQRGLFDSFSREYASVGRTSGIHKTCGRGNR
jgi:hypothetical protein